MSFPVLAAELIDKDIWYPTILGILVVVFAVGLFCGSVYLLLATNLGARLGFLVAFTGLAGLMVILSSLWITTASPVNTLKGRIPSWKAVEIVKDPEEASTVAIQQIERKGRKVGAIESANVKAFADQYLIQVEALPTAPQTAEQKAIQAKFARFPVVTDYKVENTYELGGSKPNPLDFELTHTPLYAAVQFCAVAPTDTPFGVAPPSPVCDPTSDKSGYLVLKRDLGSLRVPPIVAWISSILLFCLGLLALHWRERDEQAAAKAAAGAVPAPSSPATTSPAPSS